MKPKQNGTQLADDIIQGIFFDENYRILTQISLKCVSQGQINNTGSENGLAPIKRQAIICLTGLQSIV